MDKKDLEIIEKLKEKQGYNRKTEIFELDNFINRFKDIEQYNDREYQDMFIYLIENRLNIVNERYVIY